VRRSHLPEQRATQKIAPYPIHHYRRPATRPFEGKTTREDSLCHRGRLLANARVSQSFSATAQLAPIGPWSLVNSVSDFWIGRTPSDAIALALALKGESRHMARRTRPRYRSYTSQFVSWTERLSLQKGCHSSGTAIRSDLFNRPSSFALAPIPGAMARLLVQSVSTPIQQKRTLPQTQRPLEPRNRSPADFAHSRRTIARRSVRATVVPP
jgi:hypothetical protein